MNLADQYRDRPLGTVEIKETKDSTKTEQSKPQHQQTTEKTIKMEEAVLNSVPKTLKRKTRLLLDHIKDIPSVAWSERGELVVDGQPVVGSNVTDLINDVVRKRKTVGAPHGWQAFAEVLKDANTSRELIANPDRWNVIGPTSDRSRSHVRGRRKRRTEPSVLPTGGKDSTSPVQQMTPRQQQRRMLPSPTPQPTHKQRRRQQRALSWDTYKP